MQVKQAFRDLNVTTSVIPGGCTYYMGLDVAIYKPLKRRIGELADLHRVEHRERWSNGCYTVGDRRILLTRWVGQAWGEVHAQQSSLIRQTFRKLGLSLAVDGSEDHEISVKKKSNIEVGDWKLAQEMPGEEPEAMDKDYVNNGERFFYDLDSDGETEGQ